MHRRRFALSAAATYAAAQTLPLGPVWASQPGRFVFPSIDGGTYDLATWRGRPVLVVNTASLCGFTDQYAELQQLHTTYQGRATVLAIPSDDFAQELQSNSDVAEFCEMHFGLTLPLTTIQTVRGPTAHPFYRWMAQNHGFVPQWNFNKVLLGADGAPAATWGATARPMGQRIRAALDRQIAA